MVDRHRSKAGPECAIGCSAIETCYETNARLMERSDDLPKVCTINFDVAVRQNDHIVPDTRCHVDQIGDLPVGAMRVSADHELDIDVWKARDESACDGRR